MCFPYKFSNAESYCKSAEFPYCFQSDAISIPFHTVPTLPEIPYRPYRSGTPQNPILFHTVPEPPQILYRHCSPLKPFRYTIRALAELVTQASPSTKLAQIPPRFLYRSIPFRRLRKSYTVHTVPGPPKILYCSILFLSLIHI